MKQQLNLSLLMLATLVVSSTDGYADSAEIYDRSPVKNQQNIKKCDVFAREHAYEILLNRESPETGYWVCTIEKKLPFDKAESPTIGTEPPNFVSVEEAVKALDEGIPSTFPLDVTPSLYVSKRGYWKPPREISDRIDMHTVVLVGRDNNYLKFKNSWGDSWGDGGYGYVPMEYYEGTTRFAPIKSALFSYPDNIKPDYYADIFCESSDGRRKYRNGQVENIAVRR